MGMEVHWTSPEAFAGLTSDSNVSWTSDHVIGVPLNGTLFDAAYGPTVVRYASHETDAGDFNVGTRPRLVVGGDTARFLASSYEDSNESHIKSAMAGLLAGLLDATPEQRAQWVEEWFDSGVVEKDLPEGHGLRSHELSAENRSYRWGALFAELDASLEDAASSSVAEVQLEKGGWTVAMTVPSHRATLREGNATFILVADALGVAKLSTSPGKWSDAKADGKAALAHAGLPTSGVDDGEAIGTGCG